MQYVYVVINFRIDTAKDGEKIQTIHKTEDSARLEANRQNEQFQKDQYCTERASVRKELLRP